MDNGWKVIGGDWIGLDWIGFDGWKVIVGDDDLMGDMKE